MGQKYICLPFPSAAQYRVRLRRDQPSRVSPFHDLNGFQYHPNWLHNLLIASSLGGLRL